MAEIVGRVGKHAKELVFSDLRRERSGYVSVYSLKVEGFEHRQEFIDRGEAAVILPVDFRRREVYLIEQPRFVRGLVGEAEGARLLSMMKRLPVVIAPFAVPVGAISRFEMPAGMIDPGETPLVTAARELKEETGIEIEGIVFRPVAVVHPSVGVSTERLHLFIAVLPDPVVLGEPRGDGSEQITVWKLSFEEAFRMMDAGRFENAASAILMRELKIISLQAAAGPGTPDTF